ncbi:hypothetical protein KBC80_01225 [Candidatus Woesebacteria bacterium]|jgi:DnaK suppressor protein|nr:hypothetical protein [Candidatus Woesebacteria bacterium]
MQNFPADLLAEIKNHLDLERKGIIARIATLSGQDPFTDPERAHDNAASDTEANEESNHDRMEALVSELTTQLEHIDLALTRIAQGSYGFCTVCNTMIDTDRLAVLPTATLCLTHEKEMQASKRT